MKTSKCKILYEKGTIKKLAERFNVTEPTVRLALRFVTEGEQPDMIRQAAIKDYGGVLVKRPVVISTKEE